jgi:ABC-type Zn uptake system ZnuABC Zn-binding protein ZnuA
MRLFGGLIIGFILVMFSTPLAAQQDRLTIVASHSILADVAQNVAGDAADVTSLLPRHADPHSYTPSPRELVTLAEADLVLVNGALFEAGLLENIENTAENIVEASQCIEIRPIGETDHHREAESGPCDALYVEANIPRHDDSLGLLMNLNCADNHDEDEHEHGNCDPHVWMNPQNVMLWTLTIRDTLTQLDPANSETYTQNAAAYIDQLTQLHSEIQSLAETIPPENRVLVTNHDSLGYFAAQYGFTIVGVVIPGGSTVSEPSAQDIVRLIQTIESEHVRAIFAETTINPAVAQQVADESGAVLYTLYSGSLSDEDGPASTYLDYMRTNTRTIVDGLD